MDIMECNFIIVQHFINPDPNEPCESNRLRSFYDVEELPYVGIINPMTGCEMKCIKAADCFNVERFTDSSSYNDIESSIVTNFLMNNSIENLPPIPAPSIEMKTSIHACPITPANIKPLSRGSNNLLRQNQKRILNEKANQPK